MVRFFGPGLSGAKLPGRFMGRERGGALQDEIWLATHHQEAGGEGGIKGLSEGDPKRFTRACGGIAKLPFPGLRLAVIRRSRAKLLGKGLFQQPSRGVLPRAVDPESVVFAILKHRPDHFVGKEAALDPARIEKNGEARHLGIPEFLRQFQKGIGHPFAHAVLQLDVLVGASTRHGRGEVDVELEEVERKSAGGRSNLADLGGRCILAGWGGDACTQRLEARGVAEAGFQWKLRVKAQHVLLQGIPSRHRRER